MNQPERIAQLAVRTVFLSAILVASISSSFSKSQGTLISVKHSAGTTSPTSAASQIAEDADAAVYYSSVINYLEYYGRLWNIGYKKMGPSFESSVELLATQDIQRKLETNLDTDTGAESAAIGFPSEYDFVRGLKFHEIIAKSMARAFSNLDELQDLTVDQALVAVEDLPFAPRDLGGADPIPEKLMHEYAGHVFNLYGFDIAILSQLEALTWASGSEEMRAESLSFAANKIKDLRNLLDQKFESHFFSNLERRSELGAILVHLSIFESSVILAGQMDFAISEALEGKSYCGDSDSEILKIRKKNQDELSRVESVVRKQLDPILKEIDATILLINQKSEWSRFALATDLKNSDSLISRLRSKAKIKWLDKNESLYQKNTSDRE